MPLVDDKRDQSALDVDNEPAADVDDDEPAADVDVALPEGRASGEMAYISTTDLLSEVLAMTSLS